MLSGGRCAVSAGFNQAQRACAPTTFIGPEGAPASKKIVARRDDPN
jgi:hypothetical protein